MLQQPEWLLTQASISGKNRSMGLRLGPGLAARRRASLSLAGNELELTVPHCTVTVTETMAAVPSGWRLRPAGRSTQEASGDGAGAR